ncbi:MAG: GNAT family N-acetyltransferase [Anaerolineales bacterium]|nr:GNAT family N-acetyltransferase [Anaerolineales bacterium]
MRDNKTFLRELGDGLVLRRSTPEDAEALANFNAGIHSDEGAEKPNPYIIAWTRDLLEKPHPTFHSEDFTIVEESETGKIVSSMNLISQVWAYEDIRFGVGRPELVGTLPEYRQRGLVRAQFDVIHQWSAERGELVQAITGIPYYYRLFGYEMALNLHGGQTGYLPHIPRLKEDEEEPYRVRPAQEADVPFLVRVYAQSSRRHNVTCIWDEGLMHYEISGKSELNVNRYVLRVIESSSGEAVGMLGHPPTTWDGILYAMVYEILPGVSWAAVTPSVVRYLEQQGKQYAESEKHAFEGFGMGFGEEHPVYRVMEGRLPRVRKPYAWYLRVADLLGFVRHIAPVLEERLAGSELVGYSGEVRVTFYRDGMRLVFEQGRLAVVEAWKPTPQGHSGEAGFPGLTFLQLLFGYRSLAELKYAFADCWTDGDEISALLNVLFPRKPSNVWPVS